MHGVGPAAGLVLHILYRLQWLAALADTILHTPHHPLSFPADSFTLVWESKVLLQLNNALGRLLTTQAAGQGLQLATHSFLYAGAGLVGAHCTAGYRLWAHHLKRMGSGQRASRQGRQAGAEHPAENSVP